MGLTRRVTFQYLDAREASVCSLARDSAAEDGGAGSQPQRGGGGGAGPDAQARPGPPEAEVREGSSFRWEVEGGRDECEVCWPASRLRDGVSRGWQVPGWFFLKTRPGTAPDMRRVSPACSVGATFPMLWSARDVPGKWGGSLEVTQRLVVKQSFGPA